jgi:UDP-N-acetylmuramoyl-L-alanyl-D-glutamate--2,6-diaminopimelate ligase
MPSFPKAPAWASEIATAGVTGTNGKTTTATWLAAALGTILRPVARITTVGSWVGDRELGVAHDYERCLEVLQACHAAGGRFAALELTSAALAQGFLRGWPCQAGIFTNLSLDHLEAHGSAEHYLASKAQLFVGLPDSGTAVLNACDPASALLDEVTPAGVRRLVYAVPSRGDPVLEPALSATAIRIGRAGTSFELAVTGLSGEWPVRLTLGAIGEVYVENALAALLGAFALGASPLAAAAEIEKTPLPSGRFQIVNEAPLVVIDYAHSPDALRRTLAAARALAAGEIVLVVGVGGGATRSKRTPLGEAARDADRVILTSDNPRDEEPADLVAALRAGLGDHPRVDVELDRERAIESALDAAAASDLVLIAGKGHEREQLERGVARPFSDAEVVERFISSHR